MVRSDRGILSEADREYLLSDKSGWSYQRQYKRRNAIPKRVKNGLLDFTLLFEALDEELREDVFDHDEDEGEEFSKALGDVIAFLYRETYPDFEYYLKQGVRRGARAIAESDEFDVEVEFDVTPVTLDGVDLEGVAKKVDQEKLDELSEGEMWAYLHAMRYVEDFDPKSVPEAFERQASEVMESSDPISQSQKSVQEERDRGNERLPDETPDGGRE